MFKDYKTGDRIEVSPDSWEVMRKMAELVDRNGGAGLAIDYGQDYAQGHTLRAIRQHKIVHPMSDPGSADLSADVDFLALKNAAKPVSSKWCCFCFERGINAQSNNMLIFVILSCLDLRPSHTRSFPSQLRY